MQAGETRTTAAGQNLTQGPQHPEPETGQYEQLHRSNELRRVVKEVLSFGPEEAKYPIERSVDPAMNTLLSK